MVEKQCLKHNVNHFYKHMRITLKEFQYELILKNLTLMTEIYVSILFFINVFAIWLINQRYLCVDILPPSQPTFFLHLSLGSKTEKCSSAHSAPLGKESVRQEDRASGSLVGPAAQCALCAWTRTAYSLSTVHMYLTKGCGPVEYLAQT